MSRTEQALNKLPEAALKSLKQDASILASMGNLAVAGEFKCHINGYLICLMDLGILTQTDVRLLRIYFMQKG